MHLSAMGVTAAGTVRVSQMENIPLQDMEKMNKEKCGSSIVVTDLSLKITAVRWKVMNVIPTFYW